MWKYDYSFSLPFLQQNKKSCVSSCPTFMNDYLDHLITDFFSPLLTAAKYLILFIFHLHGRLSWPLNFFSLPLLPAAKCLILFISHLHGCLSWPQRDTSIKPLGHTRSQGRRGTWRIGSRRQPWQTGVQTETEWSAWPEKLTQGDFMFTPARLKVIRRLKCWDDKKKSVQVVTLLLYTNITIAQSLNTLPVKQSHYV